MFSLDSLNQKHLEVEANLPEEIKLRIHITRDRSEIDLFVIAYNSHPIGRKNKRKFALPKIPPQSYFNPSVPDSLICVGSRWHQIGAFQSLRRDCERLRDRRKLWIVSKRRATVLLSYSEG